MDETVDGSHDGFHHSHSFFWSGGEREPSRGRIDHILDFVI
jgi:hypothetical protein